MYSAIRELSEQEIFGMYFGRVLYNVPLLIDLIFEQQSYYLTLTFIFSNLNKLTIDKIVKGKPLFKLP